MERQQTNFVILYEIPSIQLSEYSSIIFRQTMWIVLYSLIKTVFKERIHTHQQELSHSTHSSSEHDDTIGCFSRISQVQEMIGERHEPSQSTMPVVYQLHEVYLLEVSDLHLIMTVTYRHEEHHEQMRKWQWSHDDHEVQNPLSQLEQYHDQNDYQYPL